MTRSSRKPSSRRRPSAPRSTVPVELLHQCRQALEELRIAEEELQRQNEALIASRAELEAQRRLFQELFEFAPDGYLVTDGAGVIRRVNAAAAELLKVAPVRLAGKPLVVYLSRAAREAFYAVLERLYSGQAVSGWEVEIRPHRGESVPVLISVAACRSQDGVDSLYWLLRDFTELHRARQALRLSEARYRVVVEDQAELICRFLPDGTLTFVNQAYCRFYGRSAGELIGENLFTLLPEQEKPALRERLAGFAPESPMTTYECRVVKADGSSGWQHWTDRALFDPAGRCIEIQSVGRCISELKRREEELHQSRELLRRLATHLQSVREEERIAISREVHDALGQELTALKIGLVRLQRSYPSLTDDMQPLLDGVDKLLLAVQRIATELRPALLDHLGVTAAIEWQTEQFSRRTGIPCELELDGDEIVAGREQSTALFRILQEALINISRHAAASRVRVMLTRRNDRLHLVVEDDGNGITEERIHDPRSLGLLGMRERAHALGGRLKVVARRDGGTRVCARLPLSPAEERACEHDEKNSARR